jgi:hypothetical protein
MLKVMKIRLFLSCICVLFGTNLLTYAQTQYHTTWRVLASAEERVRAALQPEGLDEELLPSIGADRKMVRTALRDAGGRFYGWNEQVGTRMLAIMLTGTGLVLPFYRPQKRTEYEKEQ